MDNKRKIVIYHSYSGHTKMIANIIKKKLDCDVLELEPKYEFSSDYDEIIIGSPVWWYSITPVVREFLKENNLEGKTVIHFATNAGWLGRTFKEIEELCKNSSVTNEMNIVFGSYSDDLVTSMDEINNWINTL